MLPLRIWFWASGLAFVVMMGWAVLKAPPLPIPDKVMFTLMLFGASFPMAGLIRLLEWQAESSSDKDGEED